jgi:hypothetical protein
MFLAVTTRNFGGVRVFSDQCFDHSGNFAGIGHVMKNKKSLLVEIN